MYGLIATFTLFVSDTCYKFQCRGIKTSVRLLVLVTYILPWAAVIPLGSPAKVSDVPLRVQFLIRPQWITCPFFSWKTSIL